MLGIGLPPEEIEKRLIRLRNLEVLHTAQRFKIWHLRDENRALKKEVALLTATVKEQQNTIDDLKLQMEELRAMVFGKKRKREDVRHDDDLPPTHAFSSQPRSKESYHRNLPTEDEITHSVSHPVNCCTQCGGSFSERESKTYIEEDIPLPQHKVVIRHTIEKGYCLSCRYWSTSAPLPTTPVILGSNVKRYICYLSVVCRQSYAQIQDILEHTYDFTTSQGEIAKILEQEGSRLHPEYERLKVSIRGEPSIHLDETGWNILTGGDRGFAWTMVGGTTSDAVFLLGKTRGKGNAINLIGDSEAVVVSDDYAAYHNINNQHQLCCAHILRKLRDLATSSELSGTVKTHCRASYQTFAGIYMAIETARQAEHPLDWYDELLKQLTTFATPHPTDPKKLLRVKAQVAARPTNYLTCLKFQQVATDNNAAERSLRHLVLKRKISFGSLNEQTAETMAILLSVLMSWKRRGQLRNYLMGV